MKDFLKYLLTNIVNHPDQVEIEEREEEAPAGWEDEKATEGSENMKHLSLMIKVADADMGLVIGKGGQTIAALRRMMRLRNMATGEYQSVRVDIAEGGRQAPVEEAGEME